MACVTHAGASSNDAVMSAIKRLEAGQHLLTQQLQVLQARQQVLQAAVAENMSLTRQASQINEEEIWRDMESDRIIELQNSICC